MEKGTELLLAKRKIQEMLIDKIELDEVREKAVSEFIRGQLYIVERGQRI